VTARLSVIDLRARPSPVRARINILLL